MINLYHWWNYLYFFNNWLHSVIFCFDQSTLQSYNNIRWRKAANVYILKGGAWCLMSLPNKLLSNGKIIIKIQTQS